jgi:hypothetical protein
VGEVWEEGTFYIKIVEDWGGGLGVVVFQVKILSGQKAAGLLCYLSNFLSFSTGSTRLF